MICRIIQTLTFFLHYFSRCSVLNRLNKNVMQVVATELVFNPSVNRASLNPDPLIRLSPGYELYIGC